MHRSMRRFVGSRPLGVWLALGGMLFLIAFGMGGQGLSLIDWDLALRLQLQENDFGNPNPVERTLAHVEWGVCVGDALVLLPLLTLGFLGVACRRLWGVVAGFMAAGSLLYMVIIYSAQRLSLALRGGLVDLEHYSGLIGAFALLALVPAALVFWGLGTNVDRFAIRRPHSHRLRRSADALGPSLLEDLLICAGQVLCALPQLHQRRRWNVTRDEIDRTLSGDALVAGGVAVDRAIAIGRSPEDVWPWVARFGRGAAYYSWDFLDNRGHRHPDYLVEVGEPVVGDRVATLGVWRHVEAGRELTVYDEAPFLGMKVPTAITFRLDPTAGGGSRLHFRMRLAPPRSLRGWLAARLGLLMDQVMCTEMLRRLALLIESYPERLRTGETNRHLAPHQRDPWFPAGSEVEG